MFKRSHNNESATDAANGLLDGTPAQISNPPLQKFPRLGYTLEQNVHINMHLGL